MLKRKNTFVIAVAVLFTPIFYSPILVQVDTIFVEDLFVEDEFMETFHESFVYEFGEDFVYNQTKSMEQVAELHQTFPVNRVGETMFPAFYGGSFICEEGYLTTLLVEGVLQPRNLRILGSVGVASYSYAELNQLIEVFALQMSNPVVDTSNISTVWLDTSANKIIIELYVLNEDTVRAVEETIMSHSALYFVRIYDTPLPLGEGNDFSEEVLSPRSFAMPPGAAISQTLNGTNNRSVGYRVRDRNGHLGFVTAAHSGSGFLNLGQRFYSGSPRRFVGEVRAISRPHDAAFVRLPIGANLSDQAINGLLIRSVITNPVQGGTVTRISAGGSSSPLASNGVIRSTNVVVSLNGSSVQTVEVLGMQAASGDSGGIIVHRTTTPTIGGIIVASRTSSNFYVRASRINPALNLTTN